MPEIFGPFRDVPIGAKVVTGNTPLTGMPIPSITGGAAGPSGAYGGNSAIGDTYINSSNSKTWMTFAVLGIVGIVSLIVWKKL